MAFNDQSYALLQGSLFMQPRSLNGAPIGPMFFAGDCDKFELSPSQKFDDIQESISGLRTTAAHIPMGTDIKLKANLLNFNKQNIEVGTWGTDTGAVAAGTVSAEIVSAYNPSGLNQSIAPLANLGVSAVVVKLAGTATHVASIAVATAGTGYAPNTAFAMTLTTAVGQTAVAYSNAAGSIIGVVVSGTGTTLATAASITTPGGGTGATFTINAGQTTCVLNTDYTVDAVMGSLGIVATSTKIPPFIDALGVAPVGSGATSLTVAYSYVGYTGKVEAFTSGIQYYTMRLQGINVANNNQPVICNVYQAAMDMAKMLSLIEAKHNAMELDGMLLMDTTRAAFSSTSPYSQFFNVVKA